MLHISYYNYLQFRQFPLRFGVTVLRSYNNKKVNIVIYVKINFKIDYFDYFIILNEINYT